MQFDPKYIAFAETAQQLTQVLLNAAYLQAKQPITATHGMLLQDVARALSCAVNADDDAKNAYRAVGTAVEKLAHYTVVVQQSAGPKENQEVEPNDRYNPPN